MAAAFFHSPEVPMSRPYRAAGPLTALLLAALVTGCGDAPPPASPSPTPVPSPTASPVPVEQLPLPVDDASLTQVLLHDADGTFDRYGSIGQLQGTSSTCTAVLLDTDASDSAPAFAVTNGHCVGINGTNERMVDAEAGEAAVAFDWFVDVPDHHVVPVARIAWASMRETDIAVLELAASVGELRDLGLKGWRPMDTPLGGSRDVVMLGIPVGAPIVDIPEAERFLRLGTCSLDTEPVRLNERQWLWSHALRNDCPEVLPGNSGSAVLDAQTGWLVGLINTTTYRGEQGAECWLGRPCESTADGEVAVPDTSYAQPVAGIERCFTKDGVFTPGGRCPLEPGTGAEIAGAPLTVNPTVVPAVDLLPVQQTTWATTVAGDGITHYRYKIGPLGTQDCSIEQGYSAPTPVTTPIDDALPTTEQRLLLCVLGGPSATPDAAWQAPANASLWIAYIDTTAPTVPVTFSVDGDAKTGWRIEPVFNPPELSLYMIKDGPAKTTDCKDLSDYGFYRRIPINIPADGVPHRFCAIGFDDATNASEPAGRVLR